MSTLKNVKIVLVNDGYKIGPYLVRKENYFSDALAYLIKEETEITNDYYCHKETESSPLLTFRPFKNNGKFIMLCDEKQCYYVILVNEHYIEYIEEDLFNDITVNNVVRKLEY